jgi:DNA-binding XRE family transcriptional regulator
MEIPSHQPLYLYRRQHRLKRVALAKSIGCSTKSLSRWEHGITRPRMSWAVQASRVTGLSLDQLFGEKLLPSVSANSVSVPG